MLATQDHSQTAADAQKAVLSPDDSQLERIESLTQANADELAGLGVQIAELAATLDGFVAQVLGQDR